jgi:hypothetical protein
MKPKFKAVKNLASRLTLENGYDTLKGFKTAIAKKRSRVQK